MFHYRSIDEVKNTLEKLDVYLPFSQQTEVMRKPVQVNGVTIPNRIAIQPMEGCDGDRDGCPGELTIRRYDKFSGSGAGLIWFEATAVLEEGRANPRQIWLNGKSLDSLKALNDRIREMAVKENGYAPVLIMQATHSGRYSKPEGVPAPLIAYRNPIFEKNASISEDRIVSDDYLRHLEDRMGEAARLAEAAGFDGVDIKSCHRYLASELLSAYSRPGEYGGSFENRTRFLRNSIQKAQNSTGKNFIVSTRLNIYDGFPYPYGFGVRENNGIAPDLTEPRQLVRMLHKDLGVNLMDLTIGNPYVNPHVNRPADIQPYETEEDPLVGVARMFNCIKAVQQENPELNIIGSGVSYLRQFAPALVAGAIREGYFTMGGFGRMSFAYPDFAKTILRGEPIDPKHVCVTCGKCSLLMRYGSMAGCVIRDKFYTGLFQEVSKGKTPTV